jgi:3-deoxy-D-manno-octulosonic-acid transferase
VLWLYRLLFLPALLVILPGYLRRMFRRGGFRENFRNRFGAFDALPAKRPGVRRVWLQAVSVGVMLAIAPMLEALKKNAAVEVFLTTTTTTGYRVAQERYGALVAGLGYFPLDFWPCSARAWRRIAADLAILTEAERWPEHIHQARRRGVPVLCVNARLSDRSFRRMSRARALVRPLLGGIARVLACSELDAARFRELGFPADRVQVTGNIKLDLTVPLLDADKKTALRRELGFDANAGLIVLGSSTWPGEEAALVEVLRRARARQLACSLLLVPRHAERRDEIAALLRSTEFTHHLRSQGSASAVVDIAVADTTGELRALTQLAEVAFVGKSLPPHREGQTPVEAAALEKPILFGAGMTNFREIAAGLVAAGAARVVADDAELCAAALSLLESAEDRRAMAVAAHSWHAANRGAVQRTLRVIESIVSAAAARRD